MIAGALVAVGAPVAAAEAALEALGVEARIHIEVERRAGLLATRVHLVAGGHELGVAPVVVDTAALERARAARHRHPRPKPRRHEADRPAGLTAVATASASAVEGGPSVFVRNDDDERVDPRRKDGRPARRARRPVEPVWRQWLDGAAVAPNDVVDVLRKSALEPVVKALASKGARRAADGLLAVAGPEARIAGPAALGLVCELVVGAALVDALSPAAVTASPVALSRLARADEGVVGAAEWPCPSPWLLEVLAGVPVVERDDGEALSDVAGAALAWSVASRFGARGVSSSTRQGLGVGAAALAGRFAGARALVGPPAPVASRAGEKHVDPSLSLSASLPLDVDIKALSSELMALGVVDLSTLEEQRLDDGARRLRLLAVSPPGAVDAATSSLWRAGALDVEAAWIELRGAGVANVTVPVGRSRKAGQVGVRVQVVMDGGEVVRVEPNLDDVRAAARRERTTEQAVAAEAVAAWERLIGPAKGSDGDAR